MTTPDPPTVTVAFFTHLQSLLAAGDPSLRFLGMTADGGRVFAELLATQRGSVWNMQRLMSFHSMRDGKPQTDALRQRGVKLRLVVNPASLDLCPILSSYDPAVRVGPIVSPLMVMDTELVVVPGTDGDSIWISTDRDVVDFAVRAYEATWSASDPAVPAGEQPPLTARMLEIAWLLADGASDRQISRSLGISERTVSNEVREIGRRLGASNRAHTIARICGNPL
jgi:DNA-binding CsgD family transcriptional regulator